MSINKKIRKPNLFIVGAPKCGTTALNSFLRQHPDIFMSELKEPHYFGSDLKNESNKRTHEWYISLFKNAGNEKRIGEASPSYLYSKTAALEINEFNRNARIIAMVRNPVEMLYSVYYQRLAAGYENIRIFEEAIYAQSKKAGQFRQKVEERIGMRLPVYLDVPRFADQIKRYFQVFGKDNVHIIVHDDFVKDNAYIYSQLLNFLEVDGSFCPEFKIVNANKRFRSTDLNNMMKTVRTKCSEGLINFIRKSPFLKKLKDRIDDINRVPFQRPEMAPDVKKRLQAEYARDVERLSELLDRDLTCWTTN